MTAPWLPLGTAIVLGFVHALEVDHMMAVTTFVSTRPALRAALHFGARWGIGHSLAVLAIGGIVIATGLQWPESWNRVGEAGVGVLLIAVGVWAIHSSRKLHLHPPAEHGDHLHLHVHRAGEARHHHLHAHSVTSSVHHRHGSTIVGLFHGLAGTTGALALVPLTMIPSRWGSFLFLLAFSVGVVAAMTLYALIAALAIRQAGKSSLLVGRRITRIIGSGGIIIGAWWFFRALI